MSVIFTAAVEGPTDEAALRKIIGFVGGEIGPVYGRNGKNQILKSISGYNLAARFAPWIVLVDLDNELCAPKARTLWLPNASEFMCFRIAVRELEAWLLADRERFSSFFSVSLHAVPNTPDQLADPKETLINVVRASRKSAIRADILPDPDLGQSIGPAYTARIIEFISSEDGWRVDAAAEHSPSLRKAVDAIEAFNSKLQADL